MEHDADQLRNGFALEGHPFARAFSIIELMIVCAIVAILAAASGPSLVQTLRGSYLNRGGDRIASLMEQARLAALTRRLPVEVRFFAYADPTQPGAPGGVHSAQAFLISETGIAAPLTQVMQLPDPVVITSNPILTTLWTLPHWGQSIPPLSIPRAGGAFDCRVIRFFPSGLTSLAGNGSQASWCLTLLNSKDDLPNASAPPRDFITFVLDPFSGTLRTYRPGLR